MPITFIVPAVPVAQPRPRAVKMGSGPNARPGIVGAVSKHPIHAFKAAVQHAYLMACGGRPPEPLSGPLRLSLLFVFPRPLGKRWKRKPMPRYWADRNPKDLDNLEKSVMDALNKIAWHDDRQVCSGKPQKVIAAGHESPHLEVTIASLEGVEPPQPAIHNDKESTQ